MTSPRKSRSTLRRVERAIVRAAMRYYRWLGKPPSRSEGYYRGQPSHQLIAACAAHAAAKAKMGKGK